jgi:hypothetical protein
MVNAAAKAMRQTSSAIPPPVLFLSSGVVVGALIAC